jgi:hypothetical protein
MFVVKNALKVLKVHKFSMKVLLVSIVPKQAPVPLPVLIVEASLKYRLSLSEHAKASSNAQEG